MLTPSFELTQNEECLKLYIKAPYAKITETEICFQDYDFRFYSKPYYLRLKLPGQVIENGKESAQYDSDNGSFTIEIPKLNHGETFEGLNLLTKLLAPFKHTIKTPTIEVLDDNQENYLEDQDEEFSWSIEQVPCEEETEISILSPVKYGFASNYHSKLNKVKEEIFDCIDLCDPDGKTPTQRQKEKFEAEMEQFSDDHYLADLFQDEIIQELLKYKAKWEKEDNCKNSPQVFTEEEKAKMLKLPNKRYLLDKQTKEMLFLGLVDILLAFAYNVRTTEGENTVESSWTICKLSGTLSWLVNFSSIKEVVISFVRRSICYPLYRHWNLSMKVIEDTQKILSLGQEYVLQCLLEIHSLLQESDTKYILNELYISDYCVWIQSVSCKALLSLSDALGRIKINKEHAKLDLIELEAAAVVALKEDSEMNSGAAENHCVESSVLNDVIDTNSSSGEYPTIVPNNNTDILEITRKVDDLLLDSNIDDENFTDHKLSLESDHPSSGCIINTTSESELSDSESSSSISSSLTDSDDYSSSDLDSEDEDSGNEDGLDERCHLLAKQRS